SRLVGGLSVQDAQPLKGRSLQRRVAAGATGIADTDLGEEQRRPRRQDELVADGAEADEGEHAETSVRFWEASVRKTSRETGGGRECLPRWVESADDVGREPVELLELVVARRQDHVLDTGGFEVADALDDLAGGPEEIRLLE